VRYAERPSRCRETVSHFSIGLRISRQGNKHPSKHARTAQNNAKYA
jgi:hypothetical protein